MKSFEWFKQPGDDHAMAELQRLADKMTLSELQRFCEGTMNALVVVQDVFRTRFPTQWTTWNARFDEE